MKWFDSFGDHEAIIDEKQFKILTKKLKLPKLAPAYGGVEFLDKTFGSKSDALSIVKEENNEYRVTARTDKVKALVNEALGIKESTMKPLSQIRKEYKESLVTEANATVEVNKATPWYSVKDDDVAAALKKYKLKGKDKSTTFTVTGDTKNIGKFLFNFRHQGEFKSVQDLIDNGGRGKYSALKESVVTEAKAPTGKLNKDGEIEMTSKSLNKVHKDYKTVIDGTNYVMQYGGDNKLALHPVKIVEAV